MSHPASRRRIASAVTGIIAVALAVSGLVLTGAASPASASTPGPKPMRGAPYAQNRSNPLVGGTWAVNNGYWDNKYNHGPLYAWHHASGARKKYLGRIVRQPTTLWFTARNSNPRTRPGVVRKYIHQLQRGNRNSLVQMSLFGIFSVQGGEKNKRKPLTAAQRAAYKRWITKVSHQIGGSRVAIVMEPDLALLYNRHGKPNAKRTGGTKARMRLVAWATRYLHAHNHRAAVYLDAGDADWLKPWQAAYVLRHTGITHARGFALGATHYSSTGSDIRHGANILRSLAKKGVRGKHFVVDTADNGRGFTMGRFWAKHPRATRSSFDRYANCHSMHDSVCVALGIRPTWRVAAKSTRLGGQARSLARSRVDGYLWFGRPWLHNQASPFVLSKAVATAKYSPFQY